MRPALLLFGFGLALRVLFWLSTGDRLDAHAAAFLGDAPVWQELANAAATGADHELLRLPLRPPGMHWLVSMLWDGSQETAWRLRLVFAVLGATIAPLLYLLLRHHVRAAAAVFAGVLCAAASNLIVLGSGPHSELPYLVLVMVSLFDQERLRTAPSIAVAGRWAVLHALLCLLRAEHLLTFAALLSVLALQRAGRWRRTLLVASSVFAITLLPWHLAVRGAIDDYNSANAPALPPANTSWPGGLSWRPGALDRLRTLPAFQQGPVFQFVTDTQRTRGATVVEPADLDVVQEAYGTWPRPLPKPLICLYGGLNFFLANTPEADAGFSGAALDRAPPLAGGPSRYPPGLLQVLPRQGTLVLSYPPHLGHLLDGYRDGWREIAADPLAAALRTLRKLWHAAEGSASGLGGYALPIGLSGTRRPVDIVLADGTMPLLFRLAVLGLALAGVWTMRRQPWLWPWLAFAASKLAVTAAFFGYARQGALLIPLMATAVACVLMRSDRLRPAWILALALLAAESVRTMTTEVAVEHLDGTQVTTADDHGAMYVRYR
ncbi:MAG: hypothetical protein KDC98_09775 [Planctomycetes bacterium]|nr:hypothetical protein [Planctomycetota bacterium]